MKNSIDFIKEVKKIKDKISQKSCYYPLFRGHGRGVWKLIPSLLRPGTLQKKDPFYLEAPFFQDFIGLSGNKLETKNSWEIFFLMRHHGVPTRLLDWTDNLFVALFFALLDEKEEMKDPCIWILNPYKLNSLTKQTNSFLINPEFELDDYFEMFCKEPSAKVIKKRKVFIPKYPIALYPNRKNDRIISQSGFFTMHGQLKEGLEDIFKKDMVYKLNIPKNIISELQDILDIAGFNKYSIYRDFDTLAKHLIDTYI